MSKLLVIHPSVYESSTNDILLSSLTSDVIQLRYTEDMTDEQVLSLVSGVQLTHFSFIYHYPGYSQLPFFYDLVKEGSPSLPAESKYRYFSDRVIALIKRFVTQSPSLIVDILCCSLTDPMYKEEVLKVEQDLGINIRYSTDLTGNATEGANWIMESELSEVVNVKDTYFTNSVLGWKGVLSSDITTDIKNHVYSSFIDFDGNTFTIKKDFAWDELVAISNDPDSFIAIGNGEIFDGNGYAIDLSGYNSWEGLIRPDTIPFGTAPTIKNLGMINGSTAQYGGFIIRKFQSYFKVDNCYSTGIIGIGGGGICAGYNGDCTISNCYSTGDITIQTSGGIIGISAGNNGPCTISNCYSTGNMGIACGGIVGDGAGYNDLCTISNCYSTGTIGLIGGGIAGYSGTCTISNCVSNGDLYGPNVNATITNPSTSLSDISGILYSGWSSNDWLVGGPVTINEQSYSLPILTAFQTIPWDNTTYTKATDLATHKLIITGLTPTHKAITVNLNVTVDASGEVKIFGASPDTPSSDIIVAQYHMPVDCLYAGDASGGLIEFWEPSATLGTIVCRLADGSGNGHNYVDFYKQTARKLAKGLQRVLCDQFDCSGATPYFNNANPTKYSNPYYTMISDFGRVALSLYADKLFGHAAATAAITNDKQFMANMLSISELVASDATGTAIDRYNGWNYISSIDSWNCSDTTNETADLARKLVATLISKGIGSNGSLLIQDISGSYNGPNSTLAEIVKQVLGQDASRAMNQDNNELLPDEHQLLQFYSGDTIYVSITIKPPTVLVNPTSAQSAQQEYSNINSSMTQDVKYNIQITLDNKTVNNIGVNGQDPQVYSLPPPPSGPNNIDDGGSQEQQPPPLPPVLADNTIIVHTIQSDNTTITIKLNSDSAGTINWGDGTSDSISPNSLITINHTYNIGTYTITISGSIAELVVEQLNITQISQFSSSITSLKCNNNNLTSLPTLPSGLIDFKCNYNNLTSLPTLPSGLLYIECYNNNLTSLPTIPTGVTTLLCYYNDITQENANNIVDNLVNNGVEWGTLSIGLQKNSTLNINATDNWNNLQNALGWDVA